jgi:hypothetical protein
VIPQGEDSVLVFDPDDSHGGRPMIAYRRELDPECGLLKGEQRFASSPSRLDAALIRAWQIYLRLPRGGWKRLNFAMQRQQKTNWCWAAVAVSVSKFFKTNTKWIQCRLVNAELGRNDCCGQGEKENCNRVYYLDRALSKTDNLDSWSSGAGNLGHVMQAVEAGRPLCARVKWSDGGGHFLAIDGYNRDLDMIAVDDPWFGASDWVLSVFQTSYWGSGTWTDRYQVRPERRR